MIKKSFFIALNSLRKWPGNNRFLVLFLIMMIVLWNDMSCVVDMCRATHFRTNPLVYIFYANSPVQLFFLMAGVVFLFSDAPFVDHNQPFVMVRSGRTAWALGQILYVFAGSALYFLLVLLGSMLMLAPVSTFATDGWGKVISTLAYTDASTKFGIGIGVSPGIVSGYTPVQALLQCLSLQWLAACVLGLLMFCVNLSTRTKVGNFIAVAVVLFDLLCVNALPVYFFWASPVSLARMTVLDPSRSSMHPSPEQAYLILISLVVVLSVACLLSVRKRTVDLVEQI